MTIPASLEPDENVARKTPHTPGVLEARNVYKVFVARGKARTALRNVDLTIQRGEFVCLVGPSGCGKSTVLNMFAGLVTPTDGTILHDGRVIADVNTRVGYVTQDDNLLPWRTALANVELALECKGVGRAARRERAFDYLARVGLKGSAELYPHELSGGMRKRVSIVRTLVDDSVDVILMDEPFGPLDAQTRLVLQDELLRLWQGTGRTIVFVTHDIVEAITLSDRIATFTGVPGSIKQVRDVTLPRPRDVFHIHETPGFATIYDAIWNDLREELLNERGSDAGA
ncbi:MAG TPA: ABC transporter ATP-binding protein [Xanthobacteraceae bacterium]|nr:ABC transporter ATP-binding protein [Xanthobacteraceae bacterium]